MKQYIEVDNILIIMEYGLKHNNPDKPLSEYKNEQEQIFDVHFELAGITFVNYDDCMEKRVTKMQVTRQMLKAISKNGEYVRTLDITDDLFD